MNHCELCGGSGILNCEEGRVEAYQFGIKDPVIVWEPKASWCHGCENGKLWEGLL